MSDRELNISMQAIGERARIAAKDLSRADTNKKNKALLRVANLLRHEVIELLSANAKDLEAARSAGLSAALVDRLTLSEKSVQAMAEGIEQVAALSDPVGEMSNIRCRPSGIKVGMMRVPLGVVGIIYEARPNVTADAASLCIKSGNATILRGGSEAINSNRAIASLVQQGLQQSGLPSDSVQLIDNTGRAAVGVLIAMRGYVDVIVPRGGKGLIERLRAECRIPMIQHLEGNCHVYVEQSAETQMAQEIVENAKTQRYGTCNTAESLLVDRAVAAALLPPVLQRLRNKEVEIRGCAETQAIMPGVIEASEDDYYSEYLAPIISVKVVSGLDEAIEHINHYSSQHTDAIVTREHSAAMRFLREVDSSSVMVNASTRFADGFEYGLGAEIGISTDKIHARGPVGLTGLTSQKWVVMGEGQVRK